MMLVIEYKIYQSVYDDMVSGNQTKEIRLLNKKSEKIQIGDKIKFQVEGSDLYLIVEVTNKFIYANVNELWENKDVVLKRVKNYTKEEFLNALFEIFGKEKVLSSKLVCIEFQVLNKY